MICWQAVTFDCNGAPELMGTYRHEAAYIQQAGQIPAFVLLQQTEDPCVPPLVEPAVSEVLLTRITAIDAAGNEDCSL